MSALAVLLTAAPAPNQWPQRIALTVAIAVLFVGIVLLMRLGWRNRQRRQSDLLPLPSVPLTVSQPLLSPLDGLFVGTTTAGDWQDRVAAGGLSDRATAELRLDAAGVTIARHGADPLFVPVEAIEGARTDRALAGKVLGPGGLLVITWRHRDRLLDSGFRADDKERYVEWVSRLREIAGDRTTGKADNSTDGSGESTDREVAR